jgi:hypothetical protein
MVELENHDSLIQPAACGQGIDELDLIELFVNGNKKITNVSFMKKLKILNASYDCGIDQNGRIRESRFSNSTCRLRQGINGLDLIELFVNGNNKITNVSFMKKLKILNASHDCGIDQNDIDGLDLIELFVNDNKKITNVNFMKKLKILDASRDCGIDQNGRIRESRFSNSTCRLRTGYWWLGFN